MPQISLCMITKNEENNIEKCLNAVKDLVDEIIIVDTGSADKTIEIAKNFDKVKIFSFKWIDDFSAARNDGLKHATKDWILVLDADELLDKKGINQIKELIKEKEHDAYLLPQINYSDNRAIAGFIPSNDLGSGFSGRYVSMICRLFRNKKGYEFRGIVHELVEPSIKEKKGSLAISNIPIHHHGNANPEETKKKKEYYLRLSEKKAMESPSASAFYELGILLKENNMLTGAEDALKKALSFNKSHSMALYELGIINEKRQELDKAIKYYTDSLRIKEDSEVFFSLGTCYLKKMEFKKAYRNLTKSLLLNPNNYKTYNNLGVIYEKNNNFKEAINVLEIAIKLNPKNVIGHYNLGVNYDKIGNKEKALDCFEKALEFGHKNKESLNKKIKELKKSIKGSAKYKYTFHFGKHEHE